MHHGQNLGEAKQSISNYYEVQKQYLLQVVEHQRKAIQNFFKDTQTNL